MDGDLRFIHVNTNREIENLAAITEENNQVSTESLWYFAYGSNLSKSQMQNRVGAWKESRKVLLRGWKLLFNVHSVRWGGGTANIVQTSNSNDLVYGVVYLITESQLEILTKKYEKVSPQNITVESDRQKIIAKVYLFKQDNPKLKVAPKYLKTIIKGLIDHGYSDDVIHSVSLEAGSFPIT